MNIWGEYQKLVKAYNIIEPMLKDPELYYKLKYINRLFNSGLYYDDVYNEYRKEFKENLRLRKLKQINKLYKNK